MKNRVPSVPDSIAADQAALTRNCRFCLRMADTDIWNTLNNLQSVGPNN